MTTVYSDDFATSINSTTTVTSTVGAGSSVTISSGELLLTAATTTPAEARAILRDTTGTNFALGDTETVTLWDPGGSLQDCFPAIILRSTNDWDAGHVYMPTSGYAFEFDPFTPSSAIIYKHVGGTFTSLATGSWTTTAGTKFWQRCQAVGTTLRVKWWNFGSAEPSSWTISTTDSSLTSGGVQLRLHAAPTKTISIDQMQVDNLQSPSPPSLQFVTPGLFVSPAGQPKWQMPLADTMSTAPGPIAVIYQDASPLVLPPPGLFLGPRGRQTWQMPRTDTVVVGTAAASVPVGALPTFATSTATPTGVLSTTVDVYLDGLKQSTLEIIAGSISMSETQGVRRQCAVEAVNHDLAPKDMADLLAPKGTELWITSGIDDDLYPVGVFRLVTAEIDTKGEATTVKLAGQDRSRNVSRNQWTSPYQPATGTTVDQAISAILTDRAPNLPQLITPTNYPTPPGLVFGLQAGDPWKDCQTLAQMAGLVLFIDATGTARLQSSVPDPDNIKARFVHGGGLLHALNRKLDESQTFNGVLAVGSSPGRETVSALVWDDDPTSNSYYLGAFGESPTTITSAVITTPDQATAVATAELSRHLGLLESLHCTVKPDASLEGGDVCVVGHPTARADGLYVVSAFSLPLTPGPMTIDFRARRVL